MKYYLINDSVCWCDEFKVPFYEILDEKQFQLYMYAKSKLGTLFVEKYFGTNEGWAYQKYTDGSETGLDLLQFNPEPIGEEECKIVDSYFPCEVCSVWEDLETYLIDWKYAVYTLCSYEKLKDIIDELSDTRKI